MIVQAFRKPLITLTIVMAVQVVHAEEYTIEAIRYADSIGDPVNSMVVGAPDGAVIDSVYALWLIRGDGRNVLFDSGFHRARWFEEWAIENYLRPDEAVRIAGVAPSDVSDIVISHAHWDHMGGIDLFPGATVWIQEDEYRYYTGDAWQPGGSNGGIDPDDVEALVRINTEGRLRLVGGDDVEILPGLRVFTGARHTFQSQYLLVEGEPNYVLASDNVYLYRNLEERAASATFDASDHPANIAAQERMVKLAGSMERIVPGHDALQFVRFPTQGRIASIK